MYELPKPKLLKVFDVILSSKGKVEKLEEEESKLAAQQLAWTNLFKEAINYHERDCAELPSSPMAKIFKKDKSKLKIYPTDSIINSEFQGLTYGEVKNKIQEVSDLRKENSTTKDKLLFSVKKLKIYYDRIKELSDVYTTKDVVACSINRDDAEGQIKSNWVSLPQAIRETPELLHSLHEQRFSICMVMEIAELYPLKYPSKQKYEGCRRVYQMQYFYFVDPESPSGSGYWYLDPTGLANHEEFIIVDNTRQYEMIHTSEHEYLNTMFNWYGMHVSEIEDK